MSVLLYFFLIFLIKTGGLCSDLCVTNPEQTAKDGDDDHISDKCENPLYKYFFCRFRIDQDIKYRCNNDPGDRVCDHLYRIK